MKRRAIPSWLILAAVLATTGAAAAEEFSQTLRPDDFAAAGLGKLSPGELARLDALVRDYRAAAAASAPGRNDKSAPRREGAGTVRGSRTDAPAGGSVVRLSPGTKVEYEEMESRLVGNFSGWEPRMVFTLENGQRWQVLDTAPLYARAVTAPKVKLIPGALGSFWMEIEGAARRVKVRQVGAER